MTWPKAVPLLHNTKFGLLFFCADRHEVNLALAKHVVRVRPKHVGVAMAQVRVVVVGCRWPHGVGWPLATG